MIKLIASDVDGTLIPEGSPALHPEMCDVIKQLKEKGIMFAAASGRSFLSMLSVFKEVEDDIYFIANNGAVIRYKGDDLVVQTMKSDVADRILEYFRRQDNVFYILTTEEEDYTDCDDEEMLHWIREGYKVRLNLVEDAAALQKAYVKMAIYFKDTDAMEKIEEAKALFEDEAAVMVSGARWIDFVAKDAQKGIGVALLQKILGVSREETAAFGDNDNDISMLHAAQESYAVSQARETVKEAAKYVLPDTTTETVLNVIKELL